jgi:predicted DNA-binding transcriptional regulator AlpA
MADRIMNTPEVVEATGVSRTTLWRLEREGKFPRRRQLIGHRIGWLESEIDEWIQARPLAGDSAAA